MSRILVVEDESAIAELVAINLRHAGFEVAIAADAEHTKTAQKVEIARSGPVIEILSGAAPKAHIVADGP